MRQQTKAMWALLLSVATALSGCAPAPVFYLGEHDALSRYLEQAAPIEYPDVAHASLNEVTQSKPPFSAYNPDIMEVWPLRLEEALHMALHNAKVIKVFQGGGPNLGAVSGSIVGLPSPFGASDFLLRSVVAADGVPTVFNPAIRESDVASPLTQGVESALAEFDAQVSTSIFWERADRPQNVAPEVAFFRATNLERDTGTFRAEISKKTAPGTQFFFRNNTLYDWNNQGGRSVASEWQTDFEMEARQPLMRGSGTQVNRIPIVIARTRLDIELAGFEANVRNMVFDTEKAYWEHYFAFRFFQSQKEARDAALENWRRIQRIIDVGGGAREEELQRIHYEEALTRQQYFEFKARTEAALCDLYKTEMRLRFIMGLSPNDGRLIRPTDDPMNARVRFDWYQILNEGLTRSSELRQKKWQIKQRELELIAARNQLLPQLDAVGLYRWFGAGDHLIGNDGNDPPFPLPGSQAVEQLFHGEYQEWRLGVELNLPVGFRRELAGVRNAQLKLAREVALLEEMELELSHQLSDDLQTLECLYELTETNFNRWAAARDEVDRIVRARQAGLAIPTLRDQMDAQRRRSDARAAYYRAMINYTVAISQIHYHKGSLLEYNNVLLAEGPWPGKAYDDAYQQARRRAAGHYLDYGYTRPRVISRGEFPQHQSVQSGDMPRQPETIETPPGDAGQLLLPQQQELPGEQPAVEDAQRQPAQLPPNDTVSAVPVPVSVPARVVTSAALDNPLRPASAAEETGFDRPAGAIRLLEPQPATSASTNEMRPVPRSR